MKIIKPSFQIVTPLGYPFMRKDGVTLLRFVESMARISHRSEEKQTEDSWRSFLEAVVVKHGDWSVTEHASVTVLFHVDRGVTHELVRHRLFSFTQESTRFVRYKNTEDITVIEPEGLKSDYRDIWNDAVAHSCQAYSALLDKGAPPQMARSVLDNALASKIAITGNLRNWRMFFMARTTKETHPDFRRVTLPLLEEFKFMIPVLYDDIEPEAKQSISMGRVR